MSLCALCLSIPFNSLPNPPPHTIYLIGDCPGLVSLRPIENESFQHPIGFPYHEDVDTLAASASTCALCALIREGIQTWLDIYETTVISGQSIGTNDNRAGSFSDPFIGQKLCVTRRLSGAPGVLVLLPSPVNDGSVYVVAAIGFCVEADLTGKPSFVPLELQSGSLNSLNIARSWLKDCVENHERCPTSITPLPTRVLDVSASGAGIRLVDSVGMLGQYASLSYCWGSSEQFTTTKDNIKTRMLGINESHLPKTISDAVAITRQLAIKYLWVDSLCICQGDAEDWSRESARMTEVYSNAHIVIANNHGNDSSVGCFSTRIPRPMSELNLPGFARNLVAMVLYIQDEMWVDLGEFGGEALTKRGWALQERVLAKRLLHYNTRQMYFECNQGIISEDGCTTKNRYCSLDASLRQWHELVASYGKRKLTNSSDKFPAIGGLAKLFEKELKAQYIAGLWSTHLISGLAWSRSQQIVSTYKEYLGPSWSWASYGDRAIFSGEGGSDISKVVEWNVEPRSQSNVYGEIASAWLRIRAPILNLIPGMSESMFKLHKDGRSRYMFFDSTETESGKRHTWDLEILLLQEKAINAQIDDSYECFALIVSKVGNERKRVGCKFLWDREEVARIIEDESNWKTVTLI